MFKLVKNKYVKLLLPVFGIAFVLTAEFIIDKLFGDGDGDISNPTIMMLKPIVIAVLFLLFLYILLVDIFKSEKKVAIFNIAFLIMMLYIFEFILYKKDPFLKCKFDSNYYYSNIDKYKNVITPPNDYRGKGMLTWGNPVRRNNLNYRDKDVTISKPKGVFRIMVLGDSFTWGAGLAENERYGNILDSLLASSFKDIKIEVINCGRSSSSTIDERDSLLRLRKIVDPDLLVVGFCINDPQPKYENYSIELEKFDSRWANFCKSLIVNFSYLKLNYLGDLLSKLIYNVGEKLGSYPNVTIALANAYKTDSQSWKSFVVALKDIKAISDSIHCPAPIIAVFNQIGSIDTGEKMSKDDKERLEITSGLFKQVIKESSSLGYDAIDYAPVFNSLKGKIKLTDLPVSPLDGHPSALLNRIYANEIFKHVKKVIESKYSKISVTQ
jgi:hypothetical protein